MIWLFGEYTVEKSTDCSPFSPKSRPPAKATNLRWPSSWEPLWPTTCHSGKKHSAIVALIVENASRYTQQMHFLYLPFLEWLPWCFICTIMWSGNYNAAFDIAAVNGNSVKHNSAEVEMKFSEIHWNEKLNAAFDNIYPVWMWEHWVESWSPPFNLMVIGRWEWGRRW